MNKSGAPIPLIHRDYRLISGGNVTLIVHSPAKFPDGSDFTCEYEIRGLHSPVKRAAGGVDSIQCVLLALEMAAAALIASPEYRGRQLYWLNPDDPDLGLPLSKYGAEYGWQ